MSATKNQNMALIEGESVARLLRGLVQAVAQLLAGLEKRYVFFGDIDRIAGARIPAGASIAALD